MELRYLSGAHQAKIDLFKETLGNLKGKKILDLGCGGGFFTHIAAELGGDVLGVDYSSSAIHFAKNRYPNRQFNVADATTLQQFPDNSFDVVLLMDVIEHIYNQDQTMKEIQRILKPHGKVLISTDLEDSAWSRPLWAKYIWRTNMLSKEGRAYRLIKKVEEPRKVWKNYHDSHVAVLTLAQLKDLFVRTGYRIVSAHVYALIKVPIRNCILRFLPEKFRGDHVMILIEKKS